jgi:hypothetical protein
MRPAPLLIALSCLVSVLACAGADAQDTAGRIGHFVDFRARPGALWGHTFILYGRVDGRGRPIELHRAGLYPDDGRAGLVLGSVVPVRATVGAVPGDISETPNAIYRRPLSAVQYARLKALVARMRANERGWHMLMFNCNHFADAVAQSLGLATPPNILVPNAWVRALKSMNGG